MTNLAYSISIPIKLHKQPKKHTKKEHTRLVISTIRVGVVTKTIDEIYVLSTITKSKKVELLKISKEMWLTLKLLPQLRNGREEENKFFSWPLFHSRVSRKENVKFSEVALVAVLHFSDWLYYDCTTISVLKHYQYYNGY